MPDFDAVFATVFTNVVISTSTPPQGCLLSFLPFSHLKSGKNHVHESNHLFGKCCIHTAD
jgi:hypothetical protein